VKSSIVRACAGCVLFLSATLGAQAADPQDTDLQKAAGQAVEGKKVQWKYVQAVVEWGFQEGTGKLAFDGSIESTYDYGRVGSVKPLPGDAATTMAGPRSWKSPASAGARRGIVAALLYTDAVRGPMRTIITVRTGSGSFSFQPVDLESGPILAPEYGFFVANAPAGITAAEFQKQLAAKHLKTVRQMAREHPEQTFEDAMRVVHGNIQFPPMPEPKIEPAMSVEVPDKYLSGLWRIGAWGIIRRCGKTAEGAYIVADHPFPPLGCETDRILWALDQMGMHKVAQDGMSLWLENQQKDGCLSLNSDMEKAHKIGALQILWVMTEHYRLTGDKEWLKKESPRLRAAAGWILNRRRITMKQHLSQEERDGLKTGKWSPYGLQPRISMGDGDPSGSRYYYWADACGYRSVKLLADILGDVDPQSAAELQVEVEKYRKDILPVLEESIVLSPLIKVRDGTYRSFHPQGFQDRGPLSRALPEGVNLYSHCGPYHCDYLTSASIEAWLKSGLLSVDDPRLDGHFDVLEDVFLWDHPWYRGTKKDYNPETDWFTFGGWGYQAGWERLPEFYLAKDDVPSFLRAWVNRCPAYINLNPDPERVWTFNEHTHAPNDKSHGRAVFLSNFRNMLVMELGDALWLARATPRAWLEQGKRISVKNSPTYFGTLAYRIVSDVDNGRINATVEMPARTPPKTVVLRLRHPKSAPIKGVTVNGEEWKDFNKEKETIELKGLTGTVAVAAKY
jgi:hypothetical protein